MVCKQFVITEVPVQSCPVADAFCTLILRCEGPDRATGKSGGGRQDHFLERPRRTAAGGAARDARITQLGSVSV
jgi:hypothetical protein